MITNHIIVWLDHQEAHVIHFNAEMSEADKIKSASTHRHLHGKSGVQGAGRAAEFAPYFREVTDSLRGAIEILIVGPGSEKLEFLKYLQKHAPALAECVISTETVDHPTDRQLLAFGRKFFKKADLMR